MTRFIFFEIFGSGTGNDAGNDAGSDPGKEKTAEICVKDAPFI